MIISKVFLNKKIVLLCAKAKELKEKCIYKNIRCCRFVEMYQATYNAYLKCFVWKLIFATVVYKYLK